MTGGTQLTGTRPSAACAPTPGAPAARSSTRPMPASPSTSPAPRSTTSPATPAPGSAPSTRFPTMEALLEALAADRVRRLTAWAQQALADDDAGEAFCAYLRRAGELHAADRMLSDVVASGPGAFPRLGPALDALNAAASELLRRAQEAGAARPDASGADIAALMSGLGRAVAAFGDQLSPQRYVEILIAALRAQPAG